MSTEENKAMDEESETQEMANAVSRRALPTSAALGAEHHAPRSMFDPLPPPQLPAPPGLQHSDAWVGWYVNLAFRGNVEELQKRVLPGWHVSDDWTGPGNYGTVRGLVNHGANMAFVFHDTYQWSELHPPADADPHPRFVSVLTLSVSLKGKDSNDNIIR